MRRTAAILISLGLLLCATVGSAATDAGSADICQQDEACRAHDQRGKALASQKQYQEALQEFQAAYQLQPATAILINIGRCLQRLGRNREALDRYAAFRRAEPTPDVSTKERLNRYEEEARAAAASAETGNSSAEVSPSTPSPPPTEHGGSSAKPRPLYKRWWFWTAIGAGAAGILAVGLGVGLTPKPYREVTWP